ncbi:L-threonylcarbamoyladenylate synthase [Elusimicrobiota bacterium]
MFLEESKIADAVWTLRNNGVVILPTDTVYGLCTHEKNNAGVKRIFTIKGRDPGKPLPLLIPKIEAVWEWIERTDELDEICRKYWPGSTTLIMPLKAGGSIGIRMPDFSPVIKIMEQTGPLYATSANVSGSPAPGTINEIPEEIKKKCDLVVDFPGSKSKIPSRIIDITASDQKILRE